MSTEQIQQTLTGLAPLVTQYAVKIVGVFALLVFAWWASGLFAKAFIRASRKAKFDATLEGFVANMIRWSVRLMAILAILGMFGVETTSFAAVIGAAGLAIGLAFQGSLSNLAAGVMLLIFRPFKVGDVISVGGKSGKVNSIELMTTTLDTVDNRRIIIPNSGVFGATIENITFHSTRRVDVTVGVDYSADMKETRKILEAVAATNPHPAKDLDAQIVLVNLGASSVDWQIRVWTETANYFAVLEAITEATKAQLDDAKIGIPFPQMDVHVDHLNAA